VTGQGDDHKDLQKLEGIPALQGGGISQSCVGTAVVVVMLRVTFESLVCR